MTNPELVARLVQAAADYTGRDAMVIMGKHRDRDLVECRWACWVVLRGRGWTLQAIGRAFKRGHKTIIHGLERAKDDQGNGDPYFREICEAVKQAII